jgi:hypothetical protein
MTLNELGSLGEFVGAIAVVISLLYLALQIRHNTRAVQSGTHQAVLDGILRVSASLSDADGVARISQKANEDYGNLTDEERIRFEAYADRTVANYETAFYNCERSMIDPVLWNSWSHQILEDLSEPGLRHFWEEKKHHYLVEFVEYVDQNVDRGAGAALNRRR